MFAGADRMLSVKIDQADVTAEGTESYHTPLKAIKAALGKKQLEAEWKRSDFWRHLALH